MKLCGHCGTANPEVATRCAECNWTLPQAHILAKIGHALKRIAGFCALFLVLLHLLGFFLPDERGDEAYGLSSWLFFLCGMGIAATMFWIGDFLKRRC